MVKTKGKRTTPNLERLRKSKTIPDQSMNIKELVRRYVKGIPADVVQREKVYVDQDDMDLEKLARLDLPDRMYEAQQMRSQAEALGEQAKEAIQRAQQAQEQKEHDRQERSDDRNSGIDDLDNTMPDDTDLNTRPLPNVGQGVKKGVRKTKN